MNNAVSILVDINVDTLKSFKIGNFEYKVGGGCR